MLLLLKYLRQQHEVAVVMPNEGTFSEALEQEHITWHTHPFRVRHVPGLVRFIRRGKYDVVYGNNFSNVCSVGLYATRLTRRPYVWHIREVFPNNHHKPEIFRRLRHAKAVITVSRSSERAIKRYLPNQDVDVIYNGVEIDDFSARRIDARRYVCAVLDVMPDRIVVTNVGRVCAQKNQLHLIEAAIPIIRKHPQVHFCLVGGHQEPEYATSIVARATEAGIANNIHMLGFRNEVPTFLCGSDILLHTSTKEAHPRVILEAMAARLPVVAYDVPGGMNETVVPDQTGYLIPFGDVAGLAHSVTKLVQNSALRQKMGAQGRERVETLFTAERTAQQINDVIERVWRS